MAAQVDLGVWLVAASDATEDDHSHDASHLHTDGTPLRATPSTAPAEDVALMAQLRLGDERALQTLIARYTNDVARIAQHYLHNEDLAYDVTQEVFIAVWERRHLLDDRTPFVHYLRRAARNRALNVLKHHAAQARVATQSALETTEPQYAENLGPVAVRAAEVDAVVQRIVATLTPRVREVLLLYYARGLEPGEIATLLGVAPRTVYGQLRTALRRLADALADHEPEGPNTSR